MGCASSINPSMVSQPDASKRPTFEQSSQVDKVKQYVEASTQTSDIQRVDTGVNTVVEKEKIDNDHSALNNTVSLNTKDPEKCSTIHQVQSQTKLIISTNQLSAFSNPRLCAKPNDEELKWILRDFEAQQFCMMLQQEIFSLGPMAIQEAVDAMKKDKELQIVNQHIWDLFEKAKETGDASYFIRAYTAESDFYKILNRTLAKQELDNSDDMDAEEQLQAMMGALFKNLDQVVSRAQAVQSGQQLPILNSNESNWAKLFLRPLYMLLSIPNSSIRFQGLTFRGMWISQDEFECYLGDTKLVCNKAITSTSKLRTVAQGFIDGVTDPPVGMVPAMFTYTIESMAAIYAMDITNYSLIPEEEEVLLLPGVFFMVSNVQVIDQCSVEIELRSTVKDMAEMMNSGISSLFSLFSE
ncbi:unnamed protein product [Rotaria socialis]|uniref:Mono(ADP-ribosyl)transferase n=2 Tax=Rotaria socialis TaxID=392032 RepID=A0A820I1K0_9BILA|nr:unnamed protein product [Rotaria socialis]CAF4305068.1 unnamed protein product [Rotaria socialis]